MKATDKKRRWVAPVIWLVVALLAIGLAFLVGMTAGRRAALKEEKKDTSAQQVRTNRVEVMRLAPGRIEDRITLPAELKAFSVAELAVEKGGRIVELPVDEGDGVEPDQVLLRVDSRLWETAVQQAEIEFRDAEKEWTRWVELEKSGAVSQSEFDAVKKRRDLAEASLEQARINLSQCEVRSPMTGVVNARYVELGEFPAEGAPVFQVVDTRRLKLEMDVPEKDVSAMKVGMPVTFIVSATGERSYTGTVSFVAAMAAPGSKAFRTEISVDEPAPVLRPGMIARVSLVRRTLDDALVVPLSAVVPRKGEHVVYTAEDGYAVRHRVILDSITGKKALLRSGVTAGDDIVVAGQRGLRDGIPIEVVRRDED